VRVTTSPTCSHDPVIADDQSPMTEMYAELLLFDSGQASPRSVHRRAAADVFPSWTVIALQGSRRFPLEITTPLPSAATTYTYK